MTDSQGSVFFTDSGPFGETGLANPTGSVFCVVDNPKGSSEPGQDAGKVLQPIAYECLANPSGLALSPDENHL